MNEKKKWILFRELVLVFVINSIVRLYFILTIKLRASTPYDKIKQF